MMVTEDAQRKGKKEAEETFQKELEDVEKDRDMKLNVKAKQIRRLNDQMQEKNKQLEEM